MEFGEKLQLLRKERGLTQEELAEQLFVSRAAVSKWESGRGYPGIDSLKAIAKYFSVSLDSLLSCDTVLAIAEEDGRQAQSRTCSLVFGLLDISGVLLLFLPVFGERTEDAVRSVSLLALQGTSLYMRAVFFALIAVSLLWGILLLTLQNSAFSFWQRWKDRGSLALSAAGTLLFMAGRQPYAGALTLVFLLIKVLLLLKRS